MAEKYIKIRGKLVAVTKDVYYTYYHMGRQHRTQAEKDRRRRIASYDALDTDDSLGVDLLVDDHSPSVEEMAVNHILSEMLRQCIARLSPAEQKIISLLFFEDLSAFSVCSLKTSYPILNTFPAGPAPREDAPRPPAQEQYLCK